MSAGYSPVRHEASDRFMEQVKQIVGPRLLVKAPLEVDLREATDLMVMKSGDFRLAVRVRTPGYFDRYPDDFTLRHWLRGNVPSELSKIKQGYADWMFYGHQLTESPRDGFRNWRLFNLDAIRVHHCQRQDPRIITSVIPNKDGYTALQRFNYLSFPKEEPKLLIAEGPHCPICERVLTQKITRDCIRAWCDKGLGHYDVWRGLADRT